MAAQTVAGAVQQTFQVEYSSSKLIDQVIVEHHSKAGEWVLFRELRTATGGGTARSIDLYAMSTWPSGRYRRIAYEVKISRSDFLREVKDPQKRRPAIMHSNEFYFVTPPGLLKPGEIPIDCGLIEVDLSVPMRRVELMQAAQLELDTFLATHSHERMPLSGPNHKKAWELQRRHTRAEMMRCCDVIVDAYWRESMPPDWPFVASMLRHGRA